MKEKECAKKKQLWCKLCNKFISYQSFRGLRLFHKHIEIEHYDEWVSSIMVLTTPTGEKE